jgi:hypothetical protein
MWMAVPWKQLIVFAPQIIDLSRELLKRARGNPAGTELVRAAEPDDVAQRVAALEENEHRQAELVARMATQLADLSKAVTVLHRRQRWLIGAVAVLGVVLVWVLVRS